VRLGLELIEMGVYAASASTSTEPGPPSPPGLRLSNLALIRHQVEIPSGDMSSLGPVAVSPPEPV